jgi:hypothetical protein
VITLDRPAAGGGASAGGRAGRRLKVRGDRATNQRTPAMSEPVFVCGVGRSGTSLVQSMLASHSELAFPPETGFLRRYVLSRALTRAYRVGGLDAVAATLADDQRIARLGVDVASVLSAFVNGGRRFSDAAVYEELLSRCSSSAGKPRVGDKDPRLIEFLPVVHRHWPRAFVVHVIRDPRDVLASKKLAAWSERKPSLLHVFASAHQLRSGRRFGPRLFADHYVELIYERLTADPETELKSVCDAIGLRYEAGMMDFAKAAKTLVSDEELAWKRETLGPLLSDNTGKWRDSLTDWEVALTELACGEAFDAGGYARSERVGTMRACGRLSVRLTSGLLACAERIYAAARTARG